MRRAFTLIELLVSISIVVCARQSRAELLAGAYVGHRPQIGDFLASLSADGHSASVMLVDVDKPYDLVDAALFAGLSDSVVSDVHFSLGQYTVTFPDSVFTEVVSDQELISYVPVDWFGKYGIDFLRFTLHPWPHGGRVIVTYDLYGSPLPEPSVPIMLLSALFLGSRCRQPLLDSLR